MSAIFSAQKSTSFPSGAHTPWKPSYLIQELVLEETKMTPLDLFLTVTRKLLVLLFTPKGITKLSMNDSTRETLNGIGMKEY